MHSTAAVLVALSALLLASLPCLAQVAAAPADPGAVLTDDDAVAVLRAWQDRAENMRGARGRAVYHYVMSDWYLRKRQEDAAVSAQRRSEDPLVRMRVGPDPEELPVIDSHHRTLVDFEFGNDRWREESVYLTVSGQEWLPVGMLSAIWRDVPAHFFYRASVCDGERIYEYDRSSNSGSILSYGASEPDGVLLTRLHILNAFMRFLVPPFNEPPDQSLGWTYEGTEQLDGRECVLLQMPSTEEPKSIHRAWISPELGYAAVREEMIQFCADTGLLASAVVYSRSDFREALPGVWCPYLVQEDSYAYTRADTVERPEPDPFDPHGSYDPTRHLPGPGDGAWKWSKVYEVLSLEVNEWSDIGPYQFPFDARVRDYTPLAPPDTKGNQVAGAALSSDRVSEAIAPDPFGVELTDEAAQALLPAAD